MAASTARKTSAWDFFAGWTVGQPEGGNPAVKKAKVKEDVVVEFRKPLNSSTSLAPKAPPRESSPVVSVPPRAKAANKQPDLSQASDSFKVTETAQPASQRVSSARKPGAATFYERWVADNSAKQDGLVAKSVSIPEHVPAKLNPRTSSKTQTKSAKPQQPEFDLVAAPAAEDFTATVEAPLPSKSNLEERHGNIRQIRSTAKPGDDVAVAYAALQKALESEERKRMAAEAAARSAEAARAEALTAVRQAERERNAIGRKVESLEERARSADERAKAAEKTSRVTEVELENARGETKIKTATYVAEIARYREQVVELQARLDDSDKQVRDLRRQIETRSEAAVSRLPTIGKEPNEGAECPPGNLSADHVFGRLGPASAHTGQDVYAGPTPNHRRPLVERLEISGGKGKGRMSVEVMRVSSSSTRHSGHLGRHLPSTPTGISERIPGKLTLSGVVPHREGSSRPTIESVFGPRPAVADTSSSVAVQNSIDEHGMPGNSAITPLNAIVRDIVAGGQDEGLIRLGIDIGMAFRRGQSVVKERLPGLLDEVMQAASKLEARMGGEIIEAEDDSGDAQADVGRNGALQAAGLLQNA